MNMNTINVYKITLKTRDGGSSTLTRTVHAKNAFYAADIAEDCNRGYEAIDCQRITPQPRINRFPTMLGN